MSDIKPDTFPKYTPNPLFKGMPAHLKDPKNFEKIQLALLETLAGKCSHSEMMGWSDCKACQNKAHERRLLMTKLGFRSAKQYLEWKKIMDIIINKKRVPLR